MQRTIFKLKPEFRDRAIGKGYSRGNPRGLGVLMDLVNN